MMSETGGTGNFYDFKARRILEYLKTDKRYDLTYIPRPFFIELTGSPSAGKTTVIKNLYSFLKHHGFKVRIPQEGAEVIQHIPRTTPEYNIRTGLYALEMLMDWSWGHQYDIVIFDRSIFDAYCWMIYWHSKDKISHAQKEYFQNFFLANFWLDRLDIAYFVTCDPAVAVRRELQFAVSEQLGHWTTPQSVASSVGRHRLAFAELSDKCPQLHLIDTTNMDQKEMNSLFTRKTLDILESKIKPA